MKDREFYKKIFKEYLEKEVAHGNRIDADSHNFPNICLMKISAYHKERGDTVEWCNRLKHYDIVYKSRVFTDEYSNEDKTVINGDLIIQGGTGYDIKNKLPHEIEHIYPDYSLYPRLTENTAYGFLTRWCPRNCPFCIVSQKEGLKAIKCTNITEFWNGQKIVKLLDANILACDEHKELLQQLVNSKSYIDFTQGLDARYVTNKNIDLLADLRIKMIHFAFDSLEDEKKIVEGLKLYKEATNINKERTSIYILTNYNTTHDDDMYRINIIQKLGYRPFVMIYNKNSAKKITKDLQRWANNKIIYAATKENFKNYIK